VIHDLGRSILADEPIDLGTACFNGIWQGDANRMILQALACCTAPGTVLNLTGPETLSVVTVARRLGRILGREPRPCPGPLRLRRGSRRPRHRLDRALARPGRGQPRQAHPLRRPGWEVL